jgi:hypothetical protein
MKATTCREETSALKKEAEALLLRIQRVLVHRDSLALQNSKLVHRRRTLAKTAEASRRARLAAIEDQLAKRNAEVRIMLSISSGYYHCSGEHEA